MTDVFELSAYNQPITTSIRYDAVFSEALIKPHEGYECAVLKFKLLLGSFEPALSGISGPARFFRTSFSMVSSRLRPVGGSPSGSEGKPAYESPESAKQPSRVSRAISSIGGLPLGAKVGGSLILALFAWLIQYRGFGYLTLGRGYLRKGALYLVAGSGLWLLPIALWWMSAG